jgi:hypothetical protein
MLKIFTKQKKEPVAVVLPDKCYICQRIPAKTVLTAALKVWANEKPKTALALGREATQLIHDTYVSGKAYSVFCGKQTNTIISGLFHWLSLKHRLTIKQCQIGKVIGCSVVSLRAAYQHWLKVLGDPIVEV